MNAGQGPGPGLGLGRLLPLSATRRRPMSRDKADTLLLMAACALVMAPHALVLPGWIAAVCVMLLAWRGWITVRGNRMPPRWLLVPIALLAMGGIYLTFRTFLGREAGVAMLVLLAAFKLLEMRARRDLLVLVFLCFFLLLTRFFDSQSIAAALLTAISVILLMTAQLSFQYGAVQPSLRRRLGLAAKIVALAAPLTLVMFVLFPRIEGPLWGLPGDAATARSGLSDSMAPGSISALALSQEIALRARFFDPPPPAGQRYWRGPVLGNYDGRTWTPLLAGFAADPAADMVPRGPAVRYQVTLEPNNRRSVFALDLPQVAPRITPQIVGNQVRIAADRQLLTRLPIARRVRYEAVSYVDYALQSAETPQRLAAWTRLPPRVNPATRAWAAQLREAQTEDKDIVAAALKQIREQPYRYTLTPPLLNGGDSIDEFLFSTRAGFCEHYAGAFVFLMRAAGIPARVVTGYLGGELNPVDGYVTVRQSDAHAWTEVWLDDRGWVRVDPTAAVAPERVERNGDGLAAASLFDGMSGMAYRNNAWLAGLATLRQNWEAVNNSWNQWVLDYTPERQRSMLSAIGLDDVSAGQLAGLMTACGALVMAAIAFFLVRSRQRTDPAQALYQNLCRRLAQRGLPRLVHEGPRAYGARLALADAAALPPAMAGAVRQFLALYENLRYGAPEAGFPGPASLPGESKQSGQPGAASANPPPGASSAKVIRELETLLSLTR